MGNFHLFRVQLTLILLLTLMSFFTHFYFPLYDTLILPCRDEHYLSITQTLCTFTCPLIAQYHFQELLLKGDFPRRGYSFQLMTLLCRSRPTRAQNAARVTSVGYNPPPTGVLIEMDFYLRL